MVEVEAGGSSAAGSIRVYPSLRVELELPSCTVGRTCAEGGLLSLHADSHNNKQPWRAGRSSLIKKKKKKMFKKWTGAW